MYANQVCSRIGCAFGKRAGLNPRETRFNGVCGALVVLVPGWVTRSACEAHKTSSRPLRNRLEWLWREDGRDAVAPLSVLLHDENQVVVIVIATVGLASAGLVTLLPGRSVPARALRRFGAGGVNVTVVVFSAVVDVALLLAEIRTHDGW